MVVIRFAFWSVLGCFYNNIHEGWGDKDIIRADIDFMTRIASLNKLGSTSHVCDKLN